MNLKASLNMYAWPEVQASLDQFWQLFQEQLASDGYDLPAQLDHNEREEIWLDEQLGLSQTCGFPLNHSLGDSVTIVGTPDYTCDYVTDGLYASVVLARKSDSRKRLLEFKDSTVAVNSLDSQSGYNALRNLLIEQNCISTTMAAFFAKGNTPFFFAKGKISNGHRQSMQAVASNLADVCAVDPVSFALAQQYEPTVESLKVIDCTASTPGLPLICSASLFGSNGTGAKQFAAYKLAVHSAWRTAAADPVSAPLMLGDMLELPRAAYSAVARHELCLFRDTI